jgi:hypothetical protein
MPYKRFAMPLLIAALTLMLCAAALADTIHLRDGSVIRGQIIAFKDQQFTVLIGAGTRGRRSRITLYMEDVESIEFDSALGNVTTGTGAAGINDVVGGNSNDRNNDTGTNDTYTPPASTRPAPTPVPRATPPASIDRTQTTPPAGAASSFRIPVRVLADNTANGWTSSGFTVRRGQRIRITASGRVSLGNGVLSTPTGLPRVVDNDKLMPNEPTGGLIAVIGDDNNDFIFIGASREFVAQRDGVLFLGVNDGNLNDNSGAYDVTVEPEASSDESH